MDDDDTKADAPLTPAEELALREAWASIGAWEPWDGQDEGATYVCPLCDGEGETEGIILDATKPFAATLGAYGIGPGLAAAELVAGSTGRLLTTLDEVRLDRDAVQALHSDALELLAATRAELDSAWQATGVASTVRGLTTLADVVTTLRESAAELRLARDEAVEALAELRAGAGTVISDLHRANQLGPCGEVRQVAIERAIAALRAAVLGGA